MNKIRTMTIAVLAVAALTGPGIKQVCAQPPDALSKAPTWRPPDASDVRTEAFSWLSQRQADGPTRAKAEALWAAGAGEISGSDLLACLVETFALADENARKLMELCSKPREELVPPNCPWMRDEKTSPLAANNLRLLYGRWLVHERLFDEALQQLAGLRPQDVVDPASLLFYQAIVHQKLLDRKAGLKAIDQLLEGVGQSPKRYLAVARLMKSDLKGLKEDTLDHIARRMEDIERRLDLGRAGPKVRQVEDGVIESLDKLIEKLEQQQQQSGSGASNLQPGSPAQDSRIMGGKGPGEVTKRDIGGQSGWGNLDPKQRDQAMQQIGREFPSHYRDVIEQYFRKLAGQSSERE